MAVEEGSLVVQVLRRRVKGMISSFSVSTASSTRLIYLQHADLETSTLPNDHQTDGMMLSCFLSLL